MAVLLLWGGGGIKIRMRTYWFMSEVLPTPLSPRMMTCDGVLVLCCAMLIYLSIAGGEQRAYLEKNLLLRRHRR